ncbi:MAG: AAA family ATPase, partial [Anaerolineales bacterium]
ERRILNALKREHPISNLAPVSFGEALEEDGISAGLSRLLEMQRLVWEVHVDGSLQDYLLHLVTATRDHPDLLLGGSPRASLALFKSAQALAAVRGRDHILPDDLKYLASPVLLHRLIVRPESELRGRTAQSILNDILAETGLELSNTPS